MGTHNYRLQITGKGEGKDLNVLPFQNFLAENTEQMSHVAARPKDYIYLRDVGCRERVMDFLRDSSSMFFKKDSNLLMGIRCFGEMHAKIHDMMKKRKGSEKLVSNVLSKLLGITLVIRLGETDIKDKVFSAKHLGRQYHTFLDDKGKKIVREYYGYITVYLRSHRNQNIRVFDTRVCAALALLREERIISGILSGTFVSNRDISRQLFSISMDRAERLDSSYDCFALIGLGDSIKALSENIRGVKESLAGNFNTDGSDWLSIFWLSMYILFVEDEERLGNFGVASSVSGPSIFARTNAVAFVRKAPELFEMDESLMKRFVANLNSKLTSVYEPEGNVASSWKKIMFQKPIKMPKTTSDALFKSWST